MLWRLMYADRVARQLPPLLLAGGIFDFYGCFA